MTRGSGGRSHWIAAVALSAAAHILLAAVIPGIPLLPETIPIMKVRLAISEQKTAPDPVPTPIKEERPRPEKAEPDAVRARKSPATKPVPEAAPERVAKMPETIETQPYEDSSTAAADPLPTPSERAATAPAEEISPSESLVELEALEIIKKVMPDYSTFSRKRKEEGTVTIIASVSEGRVVSAEIESSSGYARLDESALRAVRQWVFKSAGGIRVRVPVTFRLR